MYKPVEGAPELVRSELSMIVRIDANWNNEGSWLHGKGHGSTVGLGLEVSTKK